MFENLKVARKLGLSFCCLVAMCLIVGAVGVRSLATLNEQVDDLANSHAPALMLAGEWHAHLESTAKGMRGLFVVPLTARASELAAIRANLAERARLHEAISRVMPDGGGRTALADVEQARKGYLDLENQFLQLFESGRTDEARDFLLGKLAQAQASQIERLDKLVDALAGDAKVRGTQSTSTYHAGLNAILTVGGACALVGLLLGLFVSRSITRPVAQAVAAAERVASGDLTVRVESHRRDEIGQLLQAISNMAGNLRSLVAEVAGGARQVSDTSGQIAQGNLDLSQRTEEQASTLEETASSMEELTATVAQNAESARQVNQLAASASAVARKGGEVVGQVVQTMGCISGSSRKISEIIGVIDGIAFQTNILALNAAVEAARAGDQGRGFAVVAAEVRSLAQRSAAAAKEIKELIESSVQQVQDGSRLVTSAGKTMDDLLDSVRQVTDLTADIATASQEQTAGIEQVNTAVTQMDQAVQQNASLVEEAAAATESMRDQASALLELVSRFRLTEVESADAAPAVSAQRGRRAAVTVEPGTWTGGAPAARWTRPQAS